MERSVEFVSQDDPRLKELFDEQFDQVISESQLCWVACLSMALSAYIPQNERREQIISQVIQDVKLQNLIDERGQFNFIDGGQKLVSSLNQAATDLNLLANYIDEPRFDDYHEHLRAGEVVLFGVGREGMGHMLVMDTLFEKGEEIVYGYLDPGASSYLEARRFKNQFRMHYEHNYTDFKLLPFIITLGEHR